MGRENSLGSSGSLQPLDIASQVKKLASEVSAYTKINEPIRSRIADAAAKSAYNSCIYEWNNITGGYLSEGTMKAIDILKQKVEENLKLVPDSEAKPPTSDISKIPIHTVKTIVEQKNNRRVSAIPSYRLADGTETDQPSLYTMTASFCYDRQKFVDAFCAYQIFEDDDKEDDEFEDREEKRRKEREKRKQKNYALEKVNLSQVFIYYLRIWVLEKIVDDLTIQQKKHGISKNDIELIRNFVTRLKDFPTIFSKNEYGRTEEFDPEILNTLPVIVNITPESKIADASTRETVSCEFVVTLKLNMDYSPSRLSNKNRPSEHFVTEMANLYDKANNEISKYAKKRLEQGYLLLYYIAYGKFPEFHTEAELLECMKDAKRVMHDLYPDVLSNVIAKTTLTRTVTDTIYLYQIAKVNKIDNENPEDKIRWTEYFRMTDKSTNEQQEVPVMFSVCCRTFEKDSYTFPSGTLTHCPIQYTGYLTYLLCNPQCFKNLNNSYRREFDFRSAIYTTSGKSKYIEEHQGKSVPLYDILFAILTTVYLYTSCESHINTYKGHVNQANDTYKRIELFLPRLSVASPKTGDEKEDEKITTAGSAEFMTTLGRCLEQRLCRKQITTHTQGYIADNSSYKFQNAAQSILATLPWRVDGKIGTLLDQKRIAVLYLTKQVCERKTHVDEKRAVLATQSVFFIQNTILYAPRSNDLCQDVNGLDQQTPYDIGSYSSETQLSEFFKRCDFHKIKTVILMMDAPFTITTALDGQNIKGIDKTNIQKLEDQFPKLTFFPMFLSRLQIRDITGEHIVLRNLYSYYKNSLRIPLDAFVIGKPNFGGKDQRGYYRSGFLYETMRDYYTGRTGSAVSEYLNDPTGEFHKSIETVLLLLHLITDERAKTGQPSSEGKTYPFDRLKNEIMSSSVLTYKDGYGVRKFNYLGLISSVTNVLEKKEEKKEG